MGDIANTQHNQTIQFALAQLRKIKTEAEQPNCPGKIRLEYVFNEAGALFITRAEVKFEPIVRLPLTADMKLGWIDE